jgi:uncharacterized protein (DUF2384 family)
LFLPGFLVGSASARVSPDEAERIVKVAERFVAAVGSLIGSS